MDLSTLETLGLYDFDGQLPSLTFTAHPKLDPVTKELVCFGYEAKGDSTPDVCYYSVSPDGKFIEMVWLVAPVVAMIHDFAVTDNWVCILRYRNPCFHDMWKGLKIQEDEVSAKLNFQIIFPLILQLCDIERMKNGGEHWQWDPTIPFYLGVLPRHGAKGSDVKVSE
jgi:carotenoid cleavage dioxygenase-like enzyme